MNFVLMPQALADLVSIREYIERDSRRAAKKVAAQIRAAVHRLAEHPQLGRAGRAELTREFVIAGTPSILPYWVRDGKLEILAVIHGAREWPEEF